MVALLLVFLLTSCSTFQPMANDDVETVMPEPEAVDTALAEPVVDETQLTPDVNIVSGIKCIEGEGLVFSLTNTEESSINLADDVQILVNTLLVTPLCGVTELAPGESTECSVGADNIGLTPTLMVALPSETDARTLTC